MMIFIHHLSKSTTSTLYYRCFSSSHFTKFRDFLSRVFPPIQLKLQDLPTPDRDPSYIIDSPSVKLGKDYPLITTSLEVNQQILSSVLDAPYGQRMKPVVVVIKGMGGGKTRILEELKKSINDEEDGLSIAITFNKNSFLNPTTDFLYFDDPQLSFTLSIMIRCVCSVFKVDLENVSSLFRKHLPEFLLLKESHPHRFNVELLRSFFAWITENHPTKGGKLKTLVISIDEYQKFVDGFRQAAASRGIVVDSITPFSSSLHQALLDEELLPSLRTALIVSTLIFSDSVVTTWSGRPIRSLKLSEELAAEEVYHRWLFNSHHPWLQSWKNSHGNFKSKNDKFILFIELFSRLPRCIEFMERGMANDRKLLGYTRTEEIVVDSIYFERLLRYVLDQFSTMYMKGAFLELPLLIALLQEQPVHYHNNPSLQTHLMNSTVVNNFDPLSKNIHLIASFVGLYHGARTTRDNTENPAITQFFLRMSDNLIDKVIYSENHGDILESLGLNWIIFKLLVFQQAAFSFSLFELFMLPQEEDSSTIEAQIYKSLKTTRLIIPKSSEAIQTFSLNLPPSYDGKEEFIDAINQLPDVSAANPIQLVQFHKDECFDLLLVLYDQSKEPLLIFIDFKSKQEMVEFTSSSFPASSVSAFSPTAFHGTRNQRSRPSLVGNIAVTQKPIRKWKKSDLPKKGKQYDHIKDIIRFVQNRCIDKDAISQIIIESSALESFVKGKFFYLYITSQEYDKSFSVEKEKVIVMSRSDSQKFFSFMFPLYRTLKTLVQ